MPATIDDVARLARVSSSTVSRVINNAPNVREVTRLAVERAIKELKFEPSAFGVTLSRKSWHRLSFLAPDIAEPAYASMAQGVETHARRRGYQVSIINTKFDPHWEQHFLSGARRRTTDGFICASPTVSSARLHEVGEHVPVVCIDRSLPAWDIPSVEIDNVEAAYSAVKHLTALGHRDIAFVGLYPARQMVLDRHEGYRLALREAGVEPAPEMQWTEPEHEGGVKFIAMASKVTAEHLDAGIRPSAIFAVSDTAAIGVLHAISARGLRVPDDIALVGFDDIYLSAYLSPPLTTVAQPFERIAEVAVEMVIQLIIGQALPERRVILPTELRVRQSSGGRISALVP